MSSQRRCRPALRTTVVALLLLSAACSNPDHVKVGGKNFTEQRVLGELIAQVLESAGIPVERRLDLGGTFVCDRALRAGEIDVYVEYTGTALAAILAGANAPAGATPGAAAPAAEIPAKDSAADLERLRQAYAPAGLDWLAPLGFDNTFALAVRGDDARRLGVRTISDALPHARSWTAGFGYEFQSRPDGYPGLQTTYGLEFGQIRLLDLGLLYRAIGEKQVDLVVGSATDGPIDRLGLVVLEDDRHFFPRYDAVPVARRDTMARIPALGPALRSLAGILDAAAMRRLNDAVDGEHRDVASVVRELLQQPRHAKDAAPAAAR